MTFSFSPTSESRKAADLLVLPFWEGGKEAGAMNPLKKKIAHALKTGDFKGKNGETSLLYVEGELEPRVLLLGLGKQATSETLRRAYAAAIRLAKAKKFRQVNFVAPSVSKVHNGVRGFLEGLLLTNYHFTELKGSLAKNDSATRLTDIGVIGLAAKEEAEFDRLETISNAVLWVRDVVNRNADDKPPLRMAQWAEDLANQSKKLKIKVLGRKEIEKEQMGLLLAVNRSSTQEPCFVQLSYQGNPKSKEHIVLVGKGVTYDTGGLSLKPTDGMLDMKSDMSGAATVLASVYTAAQLGLKVNVTALAPFTENMLGSASFKPGDVYRSMNGKTVEITNTDAEGRLILADALSYAVKHLNPTCMIDIASLTGAVIVALGTDIAGVFTPDDTLAKQLQAASAETDELLWRLPMYADYKEALKSDVADLVNSAGRDASSVKAAFFLQEFVGDIRWAHIDFAGPCFHLKNPKHYNPTSATGFGVRLFVEFLEQQQ